MALFPVCAWAQSQAPVASPAVATAPPPAAVMTPMAPPAASPTAARTAPVVTSTPIAASPIVAAPTAATPIVATPIVATPVVAAAPPDPATLLLEQANFWRAQNVPDKAAFSLRRLLDLNPTSPDALALLAEIDFEQGNATEGQAFLDRLQRNDPNDPQIATVLESQQAGAIDQTQLTNARLLASNGRFKTAVQAYQAAFHGMKPPPSLEVEYYLTLGNSGIDGFEAAKKSLAAIIAANPNDVANQLAYARLLCNREFTRDDGLSRLQALSQIPSISSTARQYWRQVMLWQGPSIQSMNELKAYMASNKSDPQIDALYAEFVQTVPSDGQQARDRGFVEIDNQQWTEAETDFQTAVQDDPKDWKAMAMLAAIRNHENRTQDAHNLIQQALAIAPDQQDFIIKGSGGDWSYQALVQKGLIGKAGPGGKGGKYGKYGGRGTYVLTAAERRDYARRGAAIWQSRYAQVTRLTDQGRYDQAGRLLHTLMRGKTQSDTLVQLGDIEASAGKQAQAEGSYQRALQIQPGNPDAAAGLARLYAQQGRGDEANTYYAQAQEGYARQGNHRGLSGITNLRAQQLRAQADAASNTTQQVDLYRQAVAADPTDPWIRLSLARALQKQGRDADARAAMAPLADRRDVQAVEANIYFAQSINDNAMAAEYVAMLPAHSRTAQMRNLAEQVELQSDLARIESLPSGEQRRTALLALAREPDPTGERGEAISDALVKLGDKESVSDVVQAGLSSGGSVTPEQRVAYAQALVEADHTEQAATLIDPVDGNALPARQAVALGDVKDNIAVSRSDRLNEANRPADAYDKLAPRLAANPDDPDLRLALSRLYATNGKPKEALAISSSVLEENQGDMGVRRQAIGSALAARQYDLANHLVSDGMRQTPDDPQLYLLSAQVHQAQGANIAAVHDLEMARSLRQRQLAQTASASDGAGSNTGASQ